MTTNSSVRGEYDNTYPPLNMPVPNSKNPDGPKKYATQRAAMISNDPNEIVIPTLGRRFKDMSAPTPKEILRMVTAQYNVKLKLCASPLGNLNIRLEGRSEEGVKNAKFILKEALSVQKTLNQKMGDRHLQHFQDKKVQEGLCKGRYLYVSTDFQKKTLLLSGGACSVDRAYREVQDYMAWHTKLRKDTLKVPQILHQLLRGQDDSNLKKIIEESGKYVKIIFNTPASEEILLHGNTDCVSEAMVKLVQTQKTLESWVHVKSLRLNSHQYKEVEPLLQDQSAIQGVCLLVLDNSTSKTVQLAGVRNEVEAVYETLASRAEEITSIFKSCPYYVCQLLSRRLKTVSPANLFDDSAILATDVNAAQGFVEFASTKAGKTQAFEKFERFLQELEGSNCCDTVKVAEELLRVLLGKEWAKMKEIEAETGTVLALEQNVAEIAEFRNLEGPSHIVIMGPKQSVDVSARKVAAHLSFLGSFKSIKIDAPYHLHRYLIGVKGKVLNEIINQHAPNSTVSFGKHDPELDTCTLRGPRPEVDNLAKVMLSRMEELDRLHHLVLVKVPRNLVACMRDNSAYLSCVKRDTNVESVIFDVESKGKTVNAFVSIIGAVDNAKEAEQKIKEKLVEYAKMVTQEMVIPDNLLAAMSDYGEFILKAVADDIGPDLNISLPKEVVPKSKFTIFGPSAHVNEALLTIKKIATGEHQDYYHEKMKVVKEYAEDIKKNNGLPIFKVIENAKVRVYLPYRIGGKPNRDTILVIGRKSEVSKVINSIKEEIKLIEETIQEVIHIPSQHKRNFLKTRWSLSPLVQKISQANGGIQISIGDVVQSSDKVKVTLKGTKDNVDAAVKDIFDSVEKFNLMITEKVELLVGDVQFVLSKHRNILKDLMQRFEVVISLSQNYFDYSKDMVEQNNNTETCHVNVHGSPEAVEATCALVREWKVVSQKVPFPYRLQRSVFSFDGPHFLKITTDLHLDLTFSAAESDDSVTLYGLKSDITAGAAFIAELLEDNYQHKLHVPEKYYQQLIGRQGATIRRFNQENSVRVSFPRNDEPQEVTIFGRRENCLKAAQKLEQTVAEWDAVVEKQFSFEIRAKQELFGPQASRIPKLNSEFSVKIRFLNTKEQNDWNRVVVISGLPDNVERCYTHLSQQYSAIIDSLDETYRYRVPRNNTYLLDMSCINEVVSGPKKKRGKKKDKDSTAAAQGMNGHGSNDNRVNGQSAH